MVTQVTAFTDASGKLYKTELEAVEADCVEALKSLGALNHASAQAIARDAVKIAAVLVPLAEVQARKA